MTDIFETTPEVPARCQGCPGVAMCIENVRQLDKHAADVAEEGFSCEVSEPFQQILSSITGASPELAKAAVARVTRLSRQAAADHLESIDSQRETQLGLITELTTDCGGKHSMRAKTKLGQTVTATVCTSPKLVQEPGVPTVAFVKIT